LLDWSKLKSYHNNKHLSFEEFCYQIAKCLFHDRFTRIDDTGGGDGVEFYRSLNEGDEWGWQAKFYFPQARLNLSNRKASIEESLVSSCEKHPRLKKWILCTPTNLTPEENTWFSRELGKKIPVDMTVELEHWGDSEFNDWTRQPNFSGIRNYFFGELELSEDWYRKRFEELSRIYKDKFNAEVHTPTTLENQIQFALGETALAEELRAIVDDICARIEEYMKTVDDLKKSTPVHIDWGTAKIGLIAAHGSNERVVKDALDSLRVILRSLDQRLFDDVREWILTKSKGFLQAITHSNDAIEKESSKFDEGTLSYTGEEKERARALAEASRIVLESVRHAAALTYCFSNFVRSLSAVTQSNLNILGRPGVGKTHLVSHIVDDRIRRGIPALLVPGSRFINESTIAEQLRQIFVIPTGYSWDDFLSALNTSAEAYQTRVPIVIDGLNESIVNGALSEIWKRELPILIQQVGQLKNIVLITTCRESYEKGIWPDNQLPNKFYLSGLDSTDLEAAIQKYFAWYKIKGDLTTSSLRQFQNPIYLKIFCEANNAERQQEKEIYVREETLFEVFEVWLKQCSQSICDKLNLHSSVSVAQDSIRRIALRIWEKHVRELSIAELAEIVDDKHLNELPWDQSWTKAILDEGLLVCRDLRDQGEVAYFTYDLLGGYVIARGLVEKEKNNIDQFLKSQDVTNKLFADDLRSLHPLHEDIARSLVVVLPARTGRFLHDVREDERAFGVSIGAIFEVPPKGVSNDCVDLIAKLFSIEENRKTLIRLAEATTTQTQHPLNAVFWSKRLLELSIAERDSCWTEYVRENEEHFQGIVTRFERLCVDRDATSSIARERCHLMAQQLMWTLTSTVRALRDRATRALYWYGRWMPDRFFDLVISSLEVNDPYVSERMLAATYGVVMARHIEFTDSAFCAGALRRYGTGLYEAMFRKNAPHGTTHILMRDYARRTIELAMVHHPNLLTPEQCQRITPPFSEGGIRKWGESEDRNEEEYRDGNAPIQMDFGNYTMGRLVKDRSNYDFENTEYKTVRRNIFWRLYDLGYSLERFGQIDKQIARMDWGFGRAENGGKIDRYGKKYSWIPFFELTGFRQDMNLLPDRNGYSRVSDCDIDPSFPEDVQEHQVLKNNLLEIHSASAQEWIEETAAPNIPATFVIPRILGNDGPWVLLDGFILQEDTATNRDCFFRPRCLLVRNSDLEEFVSLLKRDLHTWIPDIPEDYYTYAGEIPWCDTFPNNGQDEMEFTVKTKTEVRPIATLAESGFVLKDQEVEIPSEVRKIAVFIPVRYNCYESYHSEVNLGRSVLVPAREISEFFQLCSQAQTFDMYERNGRKASITVKWGKEYHDSQLIFLRQDLLDGYLETKGMSLAWAISGERRLWSEKIETIGFGRSIEKYTPFSQVLTYRPTKA
jgi:hypothetical protein